MFHSFIFSGIEMAFISIETEFCSMDYLGVHTLASRTFSTISSDTRRIEPLALHKQPSPSNLLGHFQSSTAAGAFHGVLSKMQTTPYCSTVFEHIVTYKTTFLSK